MTATDRDDFSKRLATELSVRSGLRCSAPSCGVLTKGPADRPVGVVNIGVAAHIKAAAKGGPRYDPGQTPSARASIENGIWLCANCARLVDADPGNYSVETLREWKSRHEGRLMQLIGRLPDEPARMPELPVEPRYLDQKGITLRLAEAGYEVKGVFRHEANTKVALGEAEYVVDPDTDDGPARLLVGNSYGEDLVFIAVPKT